MLVYVAGPYRATKENTVEHHIVDAQAVAESLWKIGHAVICPHMNTAHMDGVVPDVEFLAGDLIMLARCDAIVMVGKWQESTGACGEFEYAQKNGIPIYYQGNAMPELHPVEVATPTQVRRFMQILMSMYRVHLAKNSDYSPANIAGTGFIGCIVRMWDKMARLMNLSGFRIKIVSSELVPEKSVTVSDETVSDTLIDMSNYGIIATMQREGSWGK